MPDSSVTFNQVQGLSEELALARLKSEGTNELPRARARTPLRIVGEVVREPMLLLLIGGGFVYLLLGDLKEALVLVAFASLSVLITVIQEARTERVLEALRDLTSPRALVIRDGQRVRIAGRDVVRGDIIILAEGDRVPADAVLRQCQDLEVDESLLTGESVPVRKRASDKGEATSASRHLSRPGGDDLPLVYSGALVVRGSGIAEVTAIGALSEIGRIGTSLRLMPTEPPRLQAEMRKLVQVFAIGGGAVCLAVIVLYGVLRGNWLDALLAGIAIGMSLLPEEFPVVLTVFMAMGAWRISKARVLTRRAAAIETLGSASVLCTDKTGTLTENRMSVAQFRLLGGEVFRPAQKPVDVLTNGFSSLSRFARLASAIDPFDPMEKAICDSDQRLNRGKITQTDKWILRQSYGLSPDLLAMSQVWRISVQHPDYVVAAKGAPEAIAELCRFSTYEVEAMNAAVTAMAEEGLRVLAVARATYVSSDPDMTFPPSQRDFEFKYLGLIGLADPLRASVPEAVRECQAAGIKVVMITGDYPATATAIARQAGIVSDNALSGDDVARMNDTQLAARLTTATVFARIMPEQKLRIVSAFKAQGQIVAMTGDGVNDAPSLKAAHIGIAMGGRGTDVAREASSIVLLDDDFGSIVKAIRLGRRIYDNLRKAVGFIVAVHIPIAGLALLPLLFGLPILLGPMHIAFLEMVIDPACSLVFEAEAEEKDVMQREPRREDAPLFSRDLILWSAAQGTVAFGVLAGIFVVALERGMIEAEVRALVFTAMVLTILSLIVANRAFGASLRSAVLRPNRALGWVIAGVVSMLGVVLYWPFAADLFSFAPLTVLDLSLSLGAGCLVLLCLEGLKTMRRHYA